MLSHTAGFGYGLVPGLPFDRYLDERLFGPLDMRDTGLQTLTYQAINDSPGFLSCSPARKSGSAQRRDR